MLIAAGVSCRKSCAEMKIPVVQQLNLPQTQQITQADAEVLPYDTTKPYNYITVSKRQLSAMLQVLEANPTCQKFRITPYPGGTLIEGYSNGQDIPIPKFVIPVMVEDPDGLCPICCD